MKPMVTVRTFAAAVGDGAAVVFGAAVVGATEVGTGAVVFGAAVGEGAGLEQAPASNATNETANKAAIMSLTVPFNLIPSFFVVYL